MNKIRILHIVQSAGGVDKYIQMLITYLNKERFENVFICSQDFNGKDYEKLVIGFEQIEMSRAIGVNDLKTIVLIRKLIKKYQPNIIYTHSSKAGAIGRIANIGLNNHCIYNPHGWSFNMRCSDKKKKIYTMIEKLAAPFCEKIICISDAEKKSALMNKICKKEKLKVIFNGIDIKSYEENKQSVIRRSDIDIPENAFVVGMVGRICQQKAPDIFIKAAKLIKDKIPSAFFLIVGNGEMEQEVREYAEEHGLGKSLFITGWVENPLSFVEVFDVACLFSRWEGFGLAIPEYMMVGKPIVATRVDAIPNIITDGENGLLVEEDNAEDACDSVLRIYNDDELKNNLISCGLEEVYEKYDARRVSKEHEKIFTEMLFKS